MNYWIRLLLVWPLSIAWVWLLSQLGAHWPDSLPLLLWRIVILIWLILYFYILHRLFKPEIDTLIKAIKERI